MSRRKGVWLVVAIALSAPFTNRAAHAGPSSKSVAQTLFDEGRRLVAAGKTTAGCEKLSESYRVDKTGGTLLNLAACHEKDGRLATARAEFEELEASAAHDGQTSRAQFARDRIAAIEPKLNKLAITLAAPAVGARVTVDGSELPSAVWGIDAPIDAGKHVIEATAPGKVPWRREVEIGGTGRSLLVDVPSLVDVVALVDAAPPIAPAPAIVVHDRAPEPPRSAATPLSLGLLGGGLVAIGVGGYFGAKAMSAQAEARGRCERGGCDDGAAQLLDQKSSSAVVATVGLAVGLTAIGAGIYFLVRPRSLAAAPAASRSPGPALAATKLFLGGLF